MLVLGGVHVGSQRIHRAPERRLGPEISPVAVFGFNFVFRHPSSRCGGETVATLDFVSKGGKCLALAPGSRESRTQSLRLMALVQSLVVLALRHRDLPERLERPFADGDQLRRVATEGDCLTLRLDRELNSHGKWPRQGFRPCLILLPPE